MAPVTRIRRTRVKVLAPSMLILALPMLGACSSTAPQSLTATWAESTGGHQSMTSIDVGRLRCSDLSGSITIATEVKKGAVGTMTTFNATRIGESTYSVSVLLDDGFVFLSNKPFTATADSVTFDEYPGAVSVSVDDPTIVDPDATLSGTVTC